MPQADVELALAWLRGEVTLGEVAASRGKFNASNSLAWVAPRLREAYRQGRIIINDVAAAEGVNLPEGVDK